MIRYAVEILNKMMLRNGGCLDLSCCTGLTELPDNLAVGGWIYRDGRKFRRTK